MIISMHPPDMPSSSSRVAWQLNRYKKEKKKKKKATKEKLRLVNSTHIFTNLDFVMVIFDQTINYHQRRGGKSTSHPRYRDDP
jgi:hypothetical protein